MAQRDLSPKLVAASQVTLVQLMEITDANIAGIVHGGTIMKLVDTAAGLAAIKHCGGLEDVVRGVRTHAGSAYLVFVALDESGGRRSPVRRAARRTCGSDPTQGPGANPYGTMVASCRAMRT